MHNEEFAARIGSGMALNLKNGKNHLPNITAHYMKRWSTFYLAVAMQYFYCWFRCMKGAVFVVVVAVFFFIISPLILYISGFLCEYYSIFHIKYKHKVSCFSSTFCLFDILWRNNSPWKSQMSLKGFQNLLTTNVICFICVNVCVYTELNWKFMTTIP